VSQPIPRYSIDRFSRYGFVDNPEGKFCEYRDYAALDDANKRNLAVIETLFAQRAELRAENERLKSRLSMSQAIAEACGEPQGDGAITVKIATSTGKTVLTDIAAKEGRDAIGCLVNPAKVSQYLPKPNAAKKGSDAK
jgi:hypothetical protein